MKSSTLWIALIGTGGAHPISAQVALPDLACEVKVYSGALVSGVAPRVSVATNQTLLLSGNPPRFTGIATVKNQGHRPATVAVGFLTTVNGSHQIGKTQTVTVAAGAQKMLWFSGWDRLVDWKNPGKNDLTARVTTDFYQGIQELNESNNGCHVALSVQVR